MTTRRAVLLLFVLVAASPGGVPSPVAAGIAPLRECVILGVLDAAPSISDAAECARATSPASTFKIPHALIALDTGVITPETAFEWDGAADDFEVWRRAHTVDSAIRWSVLPFFRRTARLIGRQRMAERLAALGYAADTFERDSDAFWINGDLVVTPLEQHAFLRRVFAAQLPIGATHLATVRTALRMPPGQVTNAAGTHGFALDWPEPVAVFAKTGNTQVDGEAVSWLVGAVESGGTTHVVVARVAAPPLLPGTAGLALARRALNAYASRRMR